MTLDVETIDLWQREHERVIAASKSGSYSEHVSRQMLVALACCRRALSQQALMDAATAYRAADAALVAFESSDDKGTTEAWDKLCGEECRAVRFLIAAALRNMDGADT